VPTLILTGDQTPPWRAQADEVVDALPDGRLVVLAGQGHSADIMAPASVAAALRMTRSSRRRRSDHGVATDAAVAVAQEPAVAPTAPTEREPVLDVLRGVALLGILLINIEYMRSAGFYDAFVGVVPTTTLADRIAQFGMGWLAAGKFLSMFAILFGVGAALIADRAIRAGRSPRRLLARRYGLLVGFGLVHMVLLFPGDILFLYGLTGLALLPFVYKPARSALRWGSGCGRDDDPVGGRDRSHGVRACAAGRP
jgi:hypothetical protein